MDAPDARPATRPPDRDGRPTGGATGGATAGAQRCPHCGARQEEGISWCAQCYADLRRRDPVPEQVPQQLPHPVPESVSEPPRPAGPVQTIAVPRDGAPPAGGDPAELDRIAAELLGGLAARPARTGLAGALDRGAGTGVTWALMVGGALGVTGLGLLLLQVLGSLL